MSSYRLKWSVARTQGGYMKEVSSITFTEFVLLLVSSVLILQSFIKVNYQHHQKLTHGIPFNLRRRNICSYQKYFYLNNLNSQWRRQWVRGNRMHIWWNVNCHNSVEERQINKCDIVLRGQWEVCVKVDHDCQLD